MATSSAIEWTEVTWNPVTGCDRVAAGCDNCYALALAKRLKAMGAEKYQNDGDPRTSGPGFGVTIHPARSAALPVADAEGRVRELDERPVPRQGAARLHPRHLRRHPGHPAAHLPGPHQARAPDGAGGRQARLARQPLDGRLGRVRSTSSTGSTIFGRRPPRRGSSRASR